MTAIIFSDKEVPASAGHYEIGDCFISRETGNLYQLVKASFFVDTSARVGFLVLPRGIILEKCLLSNIETFQFAKGVVEVLAKENKIGTLTYVNKLEITCS